MTGTQFVRQVRLKFYDYAYLTKEILIFNLTAAINTDVLDFISIIIEFLFVSIIIELLFVSIKTSSTKDGQYALPKLNNVCLYFYIPLTSPLIFLLSSLTHFNPSRLCSAINCESFILTTGDYNFPFIHY